MSNSKIKQLRGLKANIGALTLLEGQIAFTTDEGALYIGVDGTTTKTRISDVVFKNDYASLPVTGMVDKLYISSTDKKQYIWNGSAYDEITTELTSLIDDASVGTDKTLSASKIISLLSGKLDKLIGATQDTIVLVNADGTLKATTDKLSDYAKLSGGKLDESVLPAIAITDTSEVASETEMLALVAQKGDVAVRSDINKSFILKGTDPSVLANWVELRTPTDAVLSVNSKTGAVTLTTDDVAEGTTNKYITSTDKTNWDAKLDKVSSAVLDNFVSLNADGTIKDSGKKASDFVTSTDLTGFASKIVSATEDNILVQSANGDLKDSGKKLADYALKTDLDVIDLGTF